MSNTPSIDDRILDLVLQADAGNLVKVTRMVLDLLQQNNISHVMRLPPGMVGVHSQNRDGLGVNGHDVHQLLSDIYDVGWDESQIIAICSEADSAQQKSTVALMNSNRGILPQYPSEESIKYASLSATHTNQLLRCIINQMPHFDGRLTVDGKLSTQKIGLQDESMASACIHGLQWTVIPDRVFKQHPKLAALIQAGMNAASQVARQESEVQVLRKLHTYWKQEASTCGPDDKVDYNNVRRLVVRSKPPCVAALPQMYQFILKASGGLDSQFLNETETFLKTNVNSTKALGADMYASLACDLRHSIDQMIHLRHAFLKLAFCKNLSPAEAKRCLGKEGDESKQAEKTLATVRNIVGEAIPLPYDAQIVSALGNFDMEVASKLVHRSNDSYAFIAHRCIEQISNFLSLALPNPFTAAAAPEIDKAAQEAAQPRNPTSEQNMSLS
jgi:hypothetical protein